MSTQSTNYFDSVENASKYERSFGGGGQRLASSTLDTYEKSSPIKDGDRILDNACGTGIVTRAILARAGSKDIHIDAADIAEPMLNAFKTLLRDMEGANKVSIHVMDGQDLKYPDNTFDLTITQMGIMIMPDSEKALKHLYRTTKLGGKCCISTGNKMEHTRIGENVIKRLRGPQGEFDRQPSPWSDDWTRPEYIASRIEGVGFKDCVSEVKLEWSIYEGKEGVEIAVDTLSRLYENWIDFREGEKERWRDLWEEELVRGCADGDGLKMAAWVNVAWGTK